jgi:NDP-sugar pyrophosphorylase family protein
MIVAAGLGTRLRPLTELRPKPALPVRGVPLVAYPLALLARHGVREVVINVHHLPRVLEEAAERYCPPGMAVRFSREAQLLDTGGGIRRVASFLRESDPCLILAGDMLLDADLGALVRRHEERGDAITLLLKQDPRRRSFGTIGVDDAGRVCRLAERLDLGGEQDAGLWTWANVVGAGAFESVPERDVFVFLDDWVGGMLRRGHSDVRGEIAASDAVHWEPVGTLDEYLAVNLSRRSLSYLDPEALARKEGASFGSDFVVGARAWLGPGVQLRRAVVWDGEKVPPGTKVDGAVFAGGRCHPVSGEQAP